MYQGFRVMCLLIPLMSLSSVVKFAPMLPPLVLCGPSGSGKSTLLKRLMTKHKDKFGFSVSHTTRAPRPGEENGRHYHFVSRQQLRALEKNGALIEQAEFSGNLYATSKQAVMDVVNAGKICILDVDIQGVQALKNVFNKDKNLPEWPKPRFVFVRPPSLEVLEQRLVRRGTETDETINQRLAAAAIEMAYGENDNFDVVIINDDIEKAFEDLDEFVTKAYDLE